MQPKLFITNVIYGKEYTKTFLYTLTSQLTNLQYLKTKNYPAKYKIYTTNDDKKTILQSLSFKKLSQLIDVEFINMDKFFRNHDHATMTACHNDIIIRANKENAAMVFLAPDIILSNNVFEKICTSISNNIRLLVGPALRLNKENFINANASSELGNIQPRKLVKKALPHLHKLTYDTFWNNPEGIYCWPSIIGWNLDKSNLLIRGFHLHPIYIWPQKHNYTCKISIDADYVNNTCPDIKTWEVLTNSDQAVLFELTTIKRKNLGTFHKNKMKTIFYFVKNHLLYSHLLFAKSKIYLLSSDYKKNNEWQKKEKQSDKIINLVIKPYKNAFYKRYIWPLYQKKVHYYILFKQKVINFSRKKTRIIKQFFLKMKLKSISRIKISKFYSFLHKIKKKIKKI